MHRRRTESVIGTPVDVVDLRQTLALVLGWAQNSDSRAVFFCNAHSLVTATQDPGFAQVLQAADLALPDGAPVAWMVRKLGHPGQARLSGPDFMQHCCQEADVQGVSIFLVGGTASTLKLLERRLLDAWPGLRIAGSHSPPFREPTPEEDEDLVGVIEASGARLVWVGLGCPKQERWILQHRGRISAVMLGVGAAFDFHAGTLRRAPRWAQRAGLEWLFRLWSEPRRLWRRYAVTNVLFVLAAARQLLRRSGPAPHGRR